MRGIITEIQRFSLHDGPGIRSTVFLKGCNLHCAWCHNPETLSFGPELLYYAENCIGCLKCVRVCPTGAQQAVAGGHFFARHLCINCGSCAAVCFAGAMVRAGLEIEARDVVDQLLLDCDYYQKSEGGVTISGGEALIQFDFVYEVLALCKQQHIHTAIETNMAIDWDIIGQLLPVTDLIMTDIKHMDDSLHRKWTGTGNGLILENIQKLAGTKVALIVRTPLIPGVNDSEKNIRQTAACIAGLPNLLYYELLRFNPLGDRKYQALGRENEFKDASWSEPGMVKHLAALAQEFGIAVKYN